MDGEEGSEKKNLPEAARKVVDSFRSIRPGFLKGGSGRGGTTKRGGSSGAASVLGGAEKSAAGDGVEKTASSLSGVRENESKAGGFYSGSGKSSGKEGSKGKQKGKGWIKKGGPAAAIISLIVGVGALIGGSQALQPFSLVAQFQETFNSMHTSANMRSSKFFRLQMESGRVKDPVRGTIFGKTFKITKKQREKLKQYGIEYDDNYDLNGKKTKVLKFDDGSGNTKIITADNFDEIYSSDMDFHRAYNNGSMTWRGRIANWFGTGVGKFLSNNKLTRNLFNDYDSKKAEMDGDGLAAVKETLKEKTGTIDNEGEKVREAEEVKDEDDNITRQKKKEDSSADSGKMTRGDTSDLSKKMDNIKSKFASSANAICGITNAVGAVTLIVQAAEALQIINLATSYFETVDKTKEGSGSNAPINELATTLNEKKSNTNEVLKRGDASKRGDNSSGKYDALKTETVTTEKSAMESEGVTALYSGGKVNPDDASVQSFNLTASVNNIMWGIGASMAAFQTCTIAKLAVSAVEWVNGLVDFGKCVIGIATSEGGVGIPVAIEGCGELFADIAIAIGKGIVISLAIAAIFNTLLPMLTNMWTRDLISNLGGEDLGNALTSGGNMYLGGAHRMNGGSPATKKEYEAFAVDQQQVVADNARYERENLSPFDMTSKYTFMGTLMTQLMSFTSASSLMSTITSGGSVVSSSIVAMGPTAAAYDVSKTLPDEKEYEDTCPYLASIGAIGDAYCNPYVMTDVSTISDDPVDVINKLADAENFTDETTSDGNVEIDGNSDLAKYIKYCDGRNSMFGVTDYNILNDINSSTSSNTGNSYTDAAVDGAIGNIPLIGDGIDIIENAKALSYVGYISGESCVAGNNVSAASSPNWDKAKYYQRFIEDQSLAESMGVIEESAVTAYLDKYYEENPLDNSYEGTLARYSGLDKETVSDILYIARYYDFVNNYDASERYAFGESGVEMEKELRFDNENEVAENVWGVLFDQISYADVRNRSFAV